MTALAWSQELALNHPQMDHTHQEFVALLADCEQALRGPRATLLARFEALVAHTAEHFAQEDRWMAATGFAPENCHSFQHQAVLNVMRECAQRAGQADAPDFEPLGLAVGELATWFPQHARMMDAALAQHLVQLGFDTQTGRIAGRADGAPQAGQPSAAPAITSCGSTSCG